jgi:raffinose/stachyose/melibiose transport system substrate-binding protein
MQSIKQTITIAGVLTTMFILPVKAEELVIWTRTNQAAKDKALKKIFAEFEAANAVTIKMETRSVDEHKSSLRIASTSNAGPDIYYMWAGLGLGGEFVKSGIRAHLDEYYTKFRWNDRLQLLALSYVELYPPNKHGVPYQLNGEGPYYKKDLFKKAVGRGSAVFLHLARANFGPTTGCVSMTRSAMLQLLCQLGRCTILLG